MTAELRSLLRLGADELVSAFQPLFEASASSRQLYDTLSRLGWDFDGLIDSDTLSLREAVREIDRICSAVYQTIEGASQADPAIAAAGQAIAASLHRLRDVDLS